MHAQIQLINRHDTRIVRTCGACRASRGRGAGRRGRGWRRGGVRIILPRVRGGLIPRGRTVSVQNVAQQALQLPPSLSWEDGERRVHGYACDAWIGRPFFTHYTRTCTRVVACRWSPGPPGRCCTCAQARCATRASTTTRARSSSGGNGQPPRGPSRGGLLMSKHGGSQRTPSPVMGGWMGRSRHVSASWTCQKFS